MVPNLSNMWIKQHNKMLHKVHPMYNLILILQLSVNFVVKQGKRNGGSRQMLNMILVLGNRARHRSYNCPQIRNVSSTTFIMCYLATVEPQILCIKWYLNIFLRKKISDKYMSVEIRLR